MSAARRVAGALRSFGLFWWDFVVGDDVLLALGVIAGLGAVAALHHHGINAWWALPALWVLALVASLGRAVRRE